jgi:hypothetical protein
VERDRILMQLFAVEAALFVGHEIDSAYWQEWRLFGLPGGIALFALLHVPLVWALFWGYGRIPTGDRAGSIVALLLGVTGFAALFIHGFYLLGGHDEFRTPVSLGLIVVMWLVSLPLLYLSVRRLRARRPAPNA